MVREFEAATKPCHKFSAPLAMSMIGALVYTAGIVKHGKQLNNLDFGPRHLGKP